MKKKPNKKTHAQLDKALVEKAFKKIDKLTGFKPVRPVDMKKLPPPPPKKLPPPPPPKKPDAIPAASVLHQLTHQPNTATHIEYSRPPTHRDGKMVDPGVTIVIPFNCYGDFSSFTVGKVRWGKLRYGDTFVPIDDNGQTVVDNGVDPLPAKARIKPEVGATEADLPPKVLKPKAPREGVCAFIDGLIMEGTRTAEEIRDLTLAKFPGRDPNATLATVRTRPSHIKAKGQVPPAFKK